MSRRPIPETADKVSARQLAADARTGYDAFCERHGLAKPTYRSTGRKIARSIPKE
jgi:hypothetical protein